MIIKRKTFAAAPQQPSQMANAIMNKAGAVNNLAGAVNNAVAVKRGNAARLAADSSSKNTARRIQSAVMTNNVTGIKPNNPSLYKTPAKPAPKPVLSMRVISKTIKK